MKAISDFEQLVFLLWHSGLFGIGNCQSGRFSVDEQAMDHARWSAYDHFFESCVADRPK